jgi:hypothetical protein
MASTNVDSTTITSSNNPQQTVTPVQASSSAELASYTPIGFGKPLSVEILTIFTGSFKKKGLFAGDKSDILCVSGAKAPETFDATPRAINLLEQKVPEKTYLEFSALNACTPYIYYKKAMDTDTINITIELAANSFNEEILSTISNLLGKAAGLPLFMPVSGKLLAGTQLVNIIASGANDLFASGPFLSETITIRFDTAGMPVNTAQHMLICRDENEEELNNYTIETINDSGNFQMRLVNNGNVYNGDAPYIIINIDGAEKEDLQNWTATAASSSVLSEFYGDADIVAGAGQTLQQAMSLYNDCTYRTRAESLKQQLSGLAPGSDQYSAIETQYNAAIGNIQNDYFKTGLTNGT